MKTAVAARLASAGHVRRLDGLRHYLNAHRDPLLGLVWLGGFLALVASQFYAGWKYQPSEETGLHLQLGRAGAFALLPVIFTLWLPVLRNAVTWLHRSGWAQVLPLEYAKRAHRWLGHLLMALALLHGSQYLFHYAALDEPLDEVLLGTSPDLVRAMRTHMYEFVTFDEDIDATLAWIDGGASREQFTQRIQPFLREDCNKCHNPTSTMTYAKTEQPLSSYEDVLPWTRSGIASRQFRIVGSGLLMLIGFAVIWVFALTRLRRRRHHWFENTHRVGYLLALLALLHIPSLYWIATPAALLVLELVRSRRRLFHRHCPARLSRIAEDLARLDIEPPAGFSQRPGHYIYLRLRSLGRYEWHPFSLTGPGEEGHITLKIRRNGDWTGRLLDQLQQREATDLQVDVRGPYASPAAEAVRQRDWLLVAGGVGITPFLGLLRGLIQHAGPPRTLHLVWVVRELAVLRWLEPLVEHLERACCHRCHWHIYVDGECPDDCSRPFVLREGRPDWPCLLGEISRTGVTPVCYVCGPDSLRRQVVRACRSRRWRVRTEQF